MASNGQNGEFRAWGAKIVSRGDAESRRGEVLGPWIGTLRLCVSVGDGSGAGDPGFSHTKTRRHEVTEGKSGFGSELCGVVAWCEADRGPKEPKSSFTEARSHGE